MECEEKGVNLSFLSLVRYLWKGERARIRTDCVGKSFFLFLVLPCVLCCTDQRFRTTLAPAGVLLGEPALQRGDPRADRHELRVPDV